MVRKKNADVEQNGEKPRKITAGPIREKARSMTRLIAAVGAVIQKKGYTALTGPNIAKEAGLDKKLIWTYFGSIDNLVETYILQRDFWNMADQKIISELLKHPEAIGKKDITTLLHGQLDRMMKDKVLQRIIHWEIGEKNKMLRKISDKRERIGEQLFEIIEPDFSHTSVDIRTKLAIQIAGIYYLVLHARYNGSLFCGIDINQPGDLQRLRQAIQDNINAMYTEAKVDK
ncbi:TetR/AcrR family transcriptional regulator [Emticicia sp. TH156]|uniref:TetR/AcrR family transcriptional regulator n=1 Tax=Emticicia sp. TH156 TaxID=2067454 RepID=UPI000C779846|nr:TetR/AcrR family transcriptional regulator [Emticicia sp. TH156]PLK44876.1 TetR/AcrR family transcriptional regulator [Emticicia sp. TH156]